MKSLRTVTAAIVLAASLFLPSCSTSPIVKTNIFVLVDNTDKTEYGGMLSTDALLEILGEGGSVTFRALTGVEINKEASAYYEIPEGGNEVTEFDAKEAFKENLDTLIGKYLKDGVEYEKSTLFIPICEALNKLAKSPGSKTLIIVSDMVENSVYGNFYTDAGIKKGITGTEVSLPENSGIKVIILFDPRQSLKKQSQFNRAMKFWEKSFEVAGIKYTVKANL